MAIPVKVLDRLASELKRFQPILAAAKGRDVNESDTSMIVTDMMADLFGYDKIESLFLLTRESMIKSGLYAYHDQMQATNKFFLGAILLSDPVLETMRRELRRLSPDVKIHVADLRELLQQEVLKREVIEGEKAEAARKKVQKAASKLLRAKKEKEEPEPPRVQPASGSKEGPALPVKEPVGTAE